MRTTFPDASTPTPGVGGTAPDTGITASDVGAIAEAGGGLLFKEKPATFSGKTTLRAPPHGSFLKNITFFERITPAPAIHGDMGTKKGPKPSKNNGVHKQKHPKTEFVCIKRFFEKVQGQPETPQKTNGKPVSLNGAGRLIDSLSPKEAEVFHLLGRGHSPKEISEILSVGYFTVTTHQRRIQRKLDLPNQRRLLVTAIRHGAGLSQL